MLRIITLLSVITFVISSVATVLENDELEQLRQVMSKFDDDYSQGNMSKLTTDFKSALDEYGDGHQSATATVVQSFLSKLEKDGEVQGMEKLETEWKDYKVALGRHYNATENKFRMAVFESNELLTEHQNQLYAEGLTSYTCGLNDFSDWTDDEFNLLNGVKNFNDTTILRKRQNSQDRNTYYTYNIKEKLPKSVDWRKRGGVTPVRNQGECGSCYAFGALGALEAYHKRKTGKLVDLSVQNVIDCTWHLGSGGCEGGWMSPIFSYAEEYGILPESKYPYVYEASKDCKWQKNLVVAKDEGFYAIKPGDELGLQHAVAKHGPVVVAIAGHRRGFRFYKSGVYVDPKCDEVTHAVLVVGYGTHGKHGDYWIVKNSWGTSWGKDGYILMARNKGNMCFIATVASFPK